MRRALSILILILLASAPNAAAQSMFSAGGLGVPVAAVDARARALGGVGTALPNVNLSLTNPAETVGFPFRGITGTYHAQSATTEWDGESDDFAATRFPMLRIIYPFRSGLVTTIGYGAFLDETWGAVRTHPITIGDDTLNVRDAIDSSGGLARFQVGVAYPVTRSFAVGLTGGVYTGHNKRAITRDFEPVSGAPRYVDVRTDLRWRQRGPFATLGTRWDLAPGVRVAGTLTWSGTLNARAEHVDEQVIQADDYSIDLPWQATIGASALLAPRLSAVIAARWEGWSSARSDTRHTDDTWKIGGGLEWEGIQTRERAIPIRIGYQSNQYPMQIRGTQPSERSAAFGIGIPLAPTEVGPRAIVDATIERGKRKTGDAELNERFYQFTVSLSLFGG